MQTTHCTTSTLPSLVSATLHRPNAARVTPRTVSLLSGASSPTVVKPFFQGAAARRASLRSTHPLSTPPAAEPSSDSPDGQPVSRKSTQFGYSRKDVILIGAGLIAFGYVLYYGLQYGAGMDAGMAGNYVQLIIFLGICFGWVGSYLYRVANKQMTYAQQLEDYEAAVMQKRLEEMPEAEYEAMMASIEQEKAEKGN